MSTAEPRDTRQKRAIRSAIDGAQRPLSIEEIQSDAQRAQPGIGLATVYRNVRALVDGGIVQAVAVPGRPPLYERAGKAHHHHFVCADCGRVYELEGCIDAAVAAALPAGFRPAGHDVTVYGRCAACP